MLVAECHCRLVADFRRTEVLDGAGINVASVDSPLVALRSEFEEGRSVKTYESFLDNGFHFTVTAFHIHHHGDRNTACDPLYGRFHKVAYRRHVACYA